MTKLLQDSQFSVTNLRGSLARIAKFLKKETVLCVIGSAPGILAGQPNRMSEDIDFWRPLSKFSESDLGSACVKAGFLYDPKGVLTPDVPYVQIVEEGLVQLGKVVGVVTLFSDGNLTVVRPPMENIIASKMARMSEKDIEDIAFLMPYFGVTAKQVKKVIATMRGAKAEAARENLVYLEILGKKAA